MKRLIIRRSRRLWIASGSSGGSVSRSSGWIVRGMLENEDCPRPMGCPPSATFSMNEFQSPVDLIAQAADKFPHRPSWDEYFMATAVLLSTRSNCERLHVGCLIVTGGDRKNRLVAAGYNGFLPGSPHVS